MLARRPPLQEAAEAGLRISRHGEHRRLGRECHQHHGEPYEDGDEMIRVASRRGANSR
jgi:hypothetical protein